MTDPAQTLAQAAELIRDVNHTAAHHSAYEFPSEVYDSYGAMATLLERLAQTAHQHAGWIVHETDQGGVSIVSGDYTGDPQAATVALEHHTSQAAGTILDAARQLRAAHNIAATMASARQLDDPDDK